MGCEIKVWESASDELRPYLCPIVAHGPNWIVAPRAEVSKTMADIAVGRDALAELEDPISRFGIADCHPLNVGFLPDGTAVVVDYGVPNVIKHPDGSGEGTYWNDPDNFSSPCNCSECRGAESDDESASASRVWCEDCGTYHSA